MESDFATTCRQIATYFAKMADAYEQNMAMVKGRLDYHDAEINNNNNTKRKILAALQEDLNEI